MKYKEEGAVGKKKKAAREEDARPLMTNAAWEEEIAAF
ncbi:MAG: Hypothetical protein BHV28_00990 [Candidatus Tokpelaia hoelldobleri]|uniref:Uncharacterized protein n=1 Tax=Candidatus Tokpelaia hoelldobleri TaxID=1902579 RepID=A0A1U9JSJ1_9HYPH|nr:MAG: Hypothetical protein BHV28_00990 [Candidatus Tokpelaia hoelldoblerii]